MSYFLLVTDGVKAGARAALSVDEPVIVGTSYNCDIVLLDPASGYDESGPLHQAELSVTDGQWLIRILAGSASIGDVDLLREDAAELEPEMPINLGSSVFVITAESTTTTETVPTLPETKSNGKRRGLATATCVVAGACFLFAGVSAYLNAGSDTQRSETERPGMAALLEQHGFGGLRVKPQDNGSYRLNGVLQTRADHIELKSLVAASGYVTQLDVRVAEVLVEAALDIYRLHDVAAEVKLTGPAEITAVSAEVKIPLLDQIESRIRQDVPEITEILRKNTPPPLENVAETSNPLLVELPGKRIMMVASSEPAYLLTEDGARYYKGAMLPSGYKIVSILDKTVKLERDDNVVELVF